MRLDVQLARESDGRWLAEVPALPGCIAYGDTRDAAVGHVVCLALHVLADQIACGEASLGVVTGLFAVPGG